MITKTIDMQDDVDFIIVISTWTKDLLVKMIYVVDFKDLKIQWGDMPWGTGYRDAIYTQLVRSCSKIYTYFIMIILAQKLCTHFFYKILIESMIQRLLWSGHIMICNSNNNMNLHLGVHHWYCCTVMYVLFWLFFLPFNRVRKVNQNKNV